MNGLYLKIKDNNSCGPVSHQLTGIIKSIIKRTDIRDSPVGMQTTDRIDTLGSLAGISLDLDTTKGLPVGDSQHLASGLHLETEVDRGLIIDRSQNLLVDQGHPDIIPIQDKVGHPTERGPMKTPTDCSESRRNVRPVSGQPVDYGR